MSRRTRSSFLIFCVAAVILAAAGLAWACTAVPTLSADPNGGPAGTKVTINGNGFADGVPVDLRWNSPEGPIVGKANGQQFSVEVQIPANTAPGVYYLVGIQPSVRGILGRASDTFEVAAGPGAPNSVSAASASSDQWSGFQPLTSFDVPRGDPLQAPPSRAPAFALGLGLASAGMIALVAGMGIARGRQRATATGTSRQ